jgi:hypothetical protein
VFQRCWSDSDFLGMFTEPTCHLAWLSHLRTAPLLAIDVVSDARSDGSFRVVFQDGTKGIFKACEVDKLTWRAEMFAYHIDRELQIQRTPASVVRTLRWDDICRTQPHGEARTKLVKIRDRCSQAGGDTITGMMQGWTKFDVQTLARVDRVFQDQVRFELVYQPKCLRLHAHRRLVRSFQPHNNLSIIVC